MPLLNITINNFSEKAIIDKKINEQISQQEFAAQESQPTKIDCTEIYRSPKWISLQQEPNKLKAIGGYLSLLERYPNNQVDIYQKIAVIYYFDLLDKEKSRKYFDKVLDADNYNSYAFTMLARINEDLGDIRKAEELYTKAVATGLHYRPELAKFYMRMKQYEKALDILNNCQNMFVAVGGITYQTDLFLSSLVYFLLKDMGTAIVKLKFSNITKEIALREIKLNFKRNDIRNEALEYFIEGYL
jgi:tetratricopeptide (TPR) repeat protein